MRFRPPAFSGDATIYVGAAILNAAIPFVLLPFLARWMGPADFGIVGSFVALVNVLGVVVGLCTHGLIGVVFYRDGAAAARAYVGAAMAVLAATVGALSLALWLFSPLFVRLTSLPAPWLVAVVVTAAGQFSLTVILSVAQAERQPLVYGAAQVGYGAMLACLTVGLVGFAGMGWEGRALAQAVAVVFVATLGFIWVQRIGMVEWSAAKVREALRYGLPLLPHAFAVIVMATIDRFALGRSAGPEAVGFYFLAFQMCSLLLVFATAINQAWVPWLYARLQRNGQRDRREVALGLCGIAALLMTGALVGVIIAPFAVPVIAGEGFERSIVPVMLLAPAFAFQGCYFFISGLLFFHKRTGLLSTITVTSAVFQTCLSLYLARFGEVGVSAGLLVNSFVYIVAMLIAGLSVHPLGFGREEDPVSDPHPTVQ